MKKLKVLMAIMLCMSMAVCLVYAGDSHFDSVVAVPTNGQPADAYGLQTQDSNGNKLFYVDSPGNVGVTTFLTAYLTVNTNQYVMLPSEYMATVLIPLNCPTGQSCVIIAPSLQGKVFTVVNSSVGTVVIKTQGGSGVAIAGDRAAVVVCIDGKNYMKISADNQFTVY